VRKALQLLLGETPNSVAIVVLGDEAQRKRAASWRYTAHGRTAHCCRCTRKGRAQAAAEDRAVWFADRKSFAPLKALAKVICCAAGDCVSTEEQTPALYRVLIKKLAQETAGSMKVRHEEIAQDGCGCVVAVGQGSDPEDAAIVHLSYKHPKAKQTVALVGKGICFDTAAQPQALALHAQHARRHERSAVVLGILLAATQNKLAVNLDCWLALAQNHISPKAYKQNDIVKALNGTTSKSFTPTPRAGWCWPIR